MNEEVHRIGKKYLSLLLAAEGVDKIFECIAYHLYEEARARFVFDGRFGAVMQAISDRFGERELESCVKGFQDTEKCEHGRILASYSKDIMDYLKDYI